MCIRDRDRIIEGYAKEIRELRKKRSQLIGGPNQKTDDGQTEVEEIPNVSTNNNQENTEHEYTKNREKKKTEERKADEALIASKWKNQMIARYMSYYRTVSRICLLYTSPGRCYY